MCKWTPHIKFELHQAICFGATLSDGLSDTHARAHTHMRTPTRTQAHAHKTHTRTKNTHTHSRTKHTKTDTQTNTHKQTNTQTNKPTHTYTNKPTHAQTNQHTHKQTNTHINQHINKTNQHTHKHKHTKHTHTNTRVRVHTHVRTLTHTQTELIFNPCGEFRSSWKGPVSQIHSPLLHAGAPGNFSDLLRSVQMLKTEWGAESNGKLPHLFIPSKTTTLVPELAVEGLPLGRTGCLNLQWKTCPWAERSDNDDDDDDDYILYRYILFILIRYYSFEYQS